MSAPFEPVPETAEALQRLVGQGDVDLVVELFALAERVQEIVPECVGLSLGVIEDGIILTLVATSEEFAALDAVQYLDDGPCVAAAERNQPHNVELSDLLDEDRWLMYAQAGAAMGVASSLSMPITQEGRVVASVNLYASTPEAFTGRYDTLAGVIGASAEHAVANADLSFSTRLQAADAPARLDDVDDINAAVETIMESQGVDADTAQERLRQAALRAGITEGQAARAVRHLGL